jgi:hypothetical protein
MRGMEPVMSVHMTVSWRLVFPGLPDEPPVPRSSPVTISYTEPPDSVTHPFKQVVPIGSSAVAPGLAILLPA